jgi:3-oxoacyl-[acyl-carrier-protein] synthase II
MVRKRVVVTGMGCVSPLGHDVQSTWQNILDGQSGAGPITQFDTLGYKTRIAAEVKDFDPTAYFEPRKARRMDRHTQFAFVAAQQALEQANLTTQGQDGHRRGVILGTGIGGIGTMLHQHDRLSARGPRVVSPFTIPMMLPDSAASLLGLEYGLRGPNMAVVTACASGANAIGQAAETIRRGAADAMVAGGSEAAIVPITLAGFGVMGALSTHNHEPQAACRPFDLERDGFLVAEGAAILILESLEHARARGARILAEVIGYGSTNDAYHIAAPCEMGSGAAACIRVALRDAGLQPTQIDTINAHGTGTRLNDVSETRAIKDAFGEHAYDIAVCSTKSMIGHLLGAAGAIEALFCVKALQEGVIPPTINYHTPDPECDLDYVPNQARSAELRYAMTNSFGFGGHNATLILGQPPEDGKAK